MLHRIDVGANMLNDFNRNHNFSLLNIRAGADSPDRRAQPGVDFSRERSAARLFVRGNHAILEAQYRRTHANATPGLDNMLALELRPQIDIDASTLGMHDIPIVLK